LATTYFQHDADIRIRAECTFTFYHYVDNELVAKSVPFDDYIQFKAYNYLARVGTKLNGAGEENSVFTQVATGVMYESQKLQNHFKNPATISAALTMNKATLLALITPATAFVSASHGSEIAVYDSYAFSYDPDHVVPAVVVGEGDSINNKVAEKASPYIPGYNLLVFYSCRTLGTSGGASSITAGFGIGGDDRAHLGFGGNVNNYLKNVSNQVISSDYTYVNGEFVINDGMTLDYHANRLFLSLSEGKTVEKAMEYAEELYVPVITESITVIPGTTSLTGTSLPMRTPNDLLTRTWFVYLTEAERDHLGSVSQTVDRHFVKLPVNLNY
jgi:hypothetical protein